MKCYVFKVPDKYNKTEISWHQVQQYFAKYSDIRLKEDSMSKTFNVTGLCIPDKHYMIDISERIEEIVRMVENGQYFTINRPRQYGKTTILNALSNALRIDYVVIDSSFEGTDDGLFYSAENFCSRILGRFAKNIRFTDQAAYKLLLKYHEMKPENFDDLSNIITNLVEESDKEVVLLIDEVDKSSNSKIFLQFLGLLRNKYLAGNAGRDLTFKSVVLAGVHDIKNLKLAIRDESDTRFNSPWNIASRFSIEMSFSSKEIEVMLLEYKNEHSLAFDAKMIADGIYQLTSGYPYLVSDICLIIDENLNRDWSSNGVNNAARQILNEKNTLFDDVIKNIANNNDLKQVAIDILFEGKRVSYNPYAYEKGILYGIFTDRDGRLEIHNKLFEISLYNFLLEQQNVKTLAAPLTSVEQNRFIKNGCLDMETVVLKFQAFMKEEYRKEDERFYEKHGRLLFLAYLRPIINGKGFYFVESQTRENRRMDIVVTYGDKKHVIELKIWYGQQYEQEGLNQLVNYLDSQGLDEGWLITFGSHKGKQQSEGWMPFGKKRIFKVIV